jgi:hypothetical protein
MNKGKYLVALKSDTADIKDVKEINITKISELCYYITEISSMYKSYRITKEDFSKKYNIIEELEYIAQALRPSKIILDKRFSNCTSLLLMFIFLLTHDNSFSKSCLLYGFLVDFLRSLKLSLLSPIISSSLFLPLVLVLRLRSFSTTSGLIIFLSVF